jgi:hypothetical protein
MPQETQEVVTCGNFFYYMKPRIADIKSFKVYS